MSDAKINDFLYPTDIIDRNAKVTSRNFSGKEIIGPTGIIVNAEGVQGFCYELGEDEEFANQMWEAGWKVGRHKPTEQNPNPSFYIPVCVRWDKVRPTIKLVCHRSGHKTVTLLDEETVKQLDDLKISNAMICINASHHPYVRGDGSIGVKAYLRSARFTIEDDDPFADEDYDDEMTD